MLFVSGAPQPCWIVNDLTRKYVVMEITFLYWSKRYNEFLTSITVGFDNIEIMKTFGLIWINI